MRIKLKRLADLQLKDGKYNVTLIGPVNADLLAYVDFYKASYGETHAPDLLIAGIVNQFLSTDRAFQQSKRQPAPADFPARSKRGTNGTVSTDETPSPSFQPPS